MIFGKFIKILKRAIGIRKRHVRRKKRRIYRKQSIRVRVVKRKKKVLRRLKKKHVSRRKRIKKRKRVFKKRSKHQKKKHIRRIISKKKPPLIGEISHYYPNVRAAVVRLKKPLKLGDPIWVKGNKTDFRQTVGSMQINRAPISQARPGQEIGIEVLSEVRLGDCIFLSV